MNNPKLRDTDKGLKKFGAQWLPPLLVAFIVAFGGDVKALMLGNERSKINIENTTELSNELSTLDDRVDQIERESLLNGNYNKTVEQHSNQIITLRETDAKITANLAEISRNLARIMDRLDKHDRKHDG